MHTVALAVADGTPLFELAAACEVFGVDRKLAATWYTFTACGDDGARVGDWLQAGLRRGLAALAEADTVIVPSCRDAAEPPPTALVAAVRAAHEAGARVASLCTGAFVLAEAGLLDGRRATTHWAHTDLMRERYPAVRVDPDVLYVDEGDVLTSAGKAAGMDLCLHLVRLDHGTAVANALARTLVVPPHRPGGQAQYIPAAVAHGRDHVLADVLAWALARLDRPTSVRELARQAGMSPRNLARHFAATTGPEPAALAAHAAGPPGTGATRDLRPERRADRRAHRHGHRHDAPPPLQPPGRRPSRGLPPHLPHWTVTTCASAAPARGCPNGRSRTSSPG